jgi:hypothetical protein
MSGKPNITVPLDGSQAYSGTRLEESAFFRFVKGTDQVEPCRRSISTILLVELRESIMSVIALHHPDPVVRLEPEVLFPIPSLVVTNWPLKVGDTIQTEWRVPPKEPEPHRFAYQPPWLSEEDLRTDVSALL